MLGRMASSFGKGDVNILTLDVVDREEGLAIDDLLVEAPRGMQEALQTATREVPGFSVEYVRPLEAFRHVLEPLELAAELGQRGASAVPHLIEHLPDAFNATWAIAVDAAPRSAEILTASLGAPSAARLPEAWLTFDDLPAIGQAGGRAGAPPPRPRTGDGGLQVAAARLDGASTAVLLGREGGPRFRAAELRHLRLLAQIAASAAGRARGLAEVR